MLTHEILYHDTRTEVEFNQFLADHLPTLQDVQSETLTTRYEDSLGWLDVNEWANEKILSEIQFLADSIRKSCDVFVLIGVGGSNNAARSVIQALDKGDGPTVLYCGNTLSPHAYSSVLKQIQGKNFHLHCIAKNFATLEPGLAFRLLRGVAEEVYGDEAYRHISVTGTPNSDLHKLALKENYAFLTFPPNVGGRYTSLTVVGLLPMAVAGLDILAMVTGAKDMASRLLSDSSQHNPAFTYAALRQFLYRKGLGVEQLVSFEPQLAHFKLWWWQLFGESEGKNQLGVLPTYATYSEDLHSIGQYIQEGSPMVFETFLKVLNSKGNVVVGNSRIMDGFEYLDGKSLEAINAAAFEATLEAHLTVIPAIFVLSLKDISEASFGALFYFFEYACYLSCQILGVNPFDQNGVEAYKRNMFKKLKQ